MPFSPLSPPLLSTGAMWLTTWGSSSWWSPARMRTGPTTESIVRSSRARAIFTGSVDLAHDGGGEKRGVISMRGARKSCPSWPLSLGQRVHLGVSAWLGATGHPGELAPAWPADTASTVPGMEPALVAGPHAGCSLRRPPPLSSSTTSWPQLPVMTRVGLAALDLGEVGRGSPSRGRWGAAPHPRTVMSAAPGPPARAVVGPLLAVRVVLVQQVTFLMSGCFLM